MSNSGTLLVVIVDVRCRRVAGCVGRGTAQCRRPEIRAAPAVSLVVLSRPGQTSFRRPVFRGQHHDDTVSILNFTNVGNINIKTVMRGAHAQQRRPGKPAKRAKRLLDAHGNREMKGVCRFHRSPLTPP